jgi:hypothetical protein
VCCATTCDGTCLACHESKTGLPSGSCEPVVAGMDPEAECLASPSDCLAGGCRGGVGACARATSGTVCRPAAGPCDLPESCDEAQEGCPVDGYAGASEGGCVGPEVCDGLGAGDDHCKLPSGEACGNGDECLSGICLAGSCG